LPVPPAPRAVFSSSISAASRIGAEGALRRLDAVLDCRAALERNVKPDLAVETLMMQLRTG
jgi:DNA polymerase-3 subunit delta'